MRTLQRWCFQRALGALLSLLLAHGVAAAASSSHFVITNDDVAPFFTSGITFFTVEAGGALAFKEQVQTEGSGIGGGYFGLNRVVVLDNGAGSCAYASNATTGNITGVSIDTLQLGGSAFGSSSDTGISNGIGLAINNQYLYASFSDSSNIGTFQVQPGCSISFVNDVTVNGLQGGIVTGVAIHGNLMIATYGDGSMESFNISSGPPVSNGDKQNSTAYTRSQGATYANGIDITKDGHFAIFGDTSTSDNIEVSDISSGKLTPTVVFSLGRAINSSNIMLSPDETLLYIANTQGDSVTAAFFDKNTGKLSRGCTSNRIKGYSVQWSYLASMATASQTGTGDVLYVAEFSGQSAIALIQVTSSGGKCALTEMANSPVADPESAGLLSIVSFPPRSF